MSPTYFLALVMLVMFWAILLYEDDSYDLLDDEISLTLPLYHCCGNQVCSCQGGVVVVVVVVVVVLNLVALLLSISMFSPLLHLPDLGLGAVVEMMDICTKKLILLLWGERQ